jgi:hypothetical protein
MVSLCAQVGGGIKLGVPANCGDTPSLNENGPIANGFAQRR